MGLENLKSVFNENIGEQFITSPLESISQFNIGVPGTTTNFFPDPPKGRLVSPTSDDTPLKQTGRLYDSMQVKKEGIHMMDYGLTHNNGWKDGWHDSNNMPKREFIDIGLEDVNLDKLTDETIEEISKSIESKWKFSK